MLPLQLFLLQILNLPPSPLLYQASGRVFIMLYLDLCAISCLNYNTSLRLAHLLPRTNVECAPSPSSSSLGLEFSFLQLSVGCRKLIPNGRVFPSALSFLVLCSVQTSRVAVIAAVCGTKKEKLSVFFS